MTIAVPATFELQTFQEDSKSAAADSCDGERVTEQVPVVLAADDTGSELHDAQQTDETHQKMLKSILKSQAVPPLQLPQGLTSQPVESCRISSTRSSVRFSPHVEQQEFEVTRAVPVPASLRAYGGGRRTPKITAVRMADGTAVKVRSVRRITSSRKAGSSARVVVHARTSSREGSPRIVAQATLATQAGTPRVVVNTSSYPQKGQIEHGTTSTPNGTPRVVVRASPVSRDGTPRAVVRATPVSRDGTPRVVVRTTSPASSSAPRIVVQASPRLLESGADELHASTLQTEQVVINQDSVQQEEAAACDNTSGERSADLVETEVTTQAADDTSGERSADLMEKGVTTLAADDTVDGNTFDESPFEDDNALRPWVDCTELPSELQFEEEDDEDDEDTVTPEGVLATLADDEAIPIAMDIFASFYADGFITSEELGAVLTRVCKCTGEDADLLLQALQQEMNGDMQIDKLLNRIFDYTGVQLSSTEFAHPAGSSAPTISAKSAAEAVIVAQDPSCDATPDVSQPVAEAESQMGNEHSDALRHGAFEDNQLRTDAELEHTEACDISSGNPICKELTTSGVDELMQHTDASDTGAAVLADEQELARQLFMVFDSAGEGFITAEELRGVLMVVCECKHEDTVQLLQLIGEDKGGLVRIDRFLNWIMETAV